MTKGKKMKKKSFVSSFLSSNNLISILIVASIGLAFLVGIMWQKVQSLESGSSTKVADTAGANNPQAPSQAGEVDPVTDSDYIKGNRNARIALIEYSDLECPFCKSFHPTAQQAVDEYPDDIMWVYRHFPLELHPKASKQAEAVECAGKLAGNDGFWALIDKIFEVTPSNNGLDNSILPNLATGVGIDKSAFQICLGSGEMAKNVDDDYQSGLKAGVTGTPGNILFDTKTGESVLIPGAVPYPQLKQAIDDMLAKS